MTKAHESPEENSGLEITKAEADHVESRYILFQLGEELFGTQLLGVKEIVEPLSHKPIPNSKKHFMGMINLRGQILGVIDLRKRLGNEIKEEPSAFIVCETEDGTALAAAVDKVVAVGSIGADEIDQDPKITSEIPTRFLKGVGKYKEDLVIIIDLKELLMSEDLLILRAS